MRTILALLSTVAVLALAGSAGAMPIDNAGPSTADPTPTTIIQPAPASGGTETWVVIAAAAVAFGAGAGAARLAPVVRLRVGAS